MQRSRLDWIFVAKQPLPTGKASASLDPLDRAARIADVKDKMIACLEELDRLQIVYAANYLSHAIALVEGED